MKEHLESLERLADLFQKGVLSKEEFEEEKAYLLAQSRSSKRSETSRLRSMLASTKGKVALAVVGALVVGATVGYLVWRDIKSHPSASDRIAEQPLSRGKEKLSHAALGFANLRNCEPNVELSGLFDRIRDARASTSANDRLLYLAGVEQPVEVRSMETSDERHIQLAGIPIRASWNGLDIREVRTLDWSGGGGFQLIFDQPPAQLTRTLSQLGLDVATANKNPADEGRVALVEPFAGGSSWTCVWAIGRPENKAEGGESSR